MDADLYINECSFRYNGEDTSDNVIRKILLFGGKRPKMAY